MSLVKMVSEVRVPSASPIKIIGYVTGYFVLVGAMDFTVSLLEDGVAMRKPMLTRIGCKLSAASRCPLWHREIRFW